MAGAHVRALTATVSNGRTREESPDVGGKSLDFLDKPARQAGVGINLLIKASTAVRMLVGATFMVVLWFAGNVVYFHTARVWEVPFVHQSHWLVVAACSALVLSRAMRVRGSLEDRIQQVLGSTAVLFGAYALIILLGRHFFSRSILVSMIPATVLLGLAIVWFRSRRIGTKVAVIAPLVKRIQPELEDVPRIDDPNHDFRRYDVILVDLHEPVSGDWARAMSRAMLCGCRVRHLEDHVEEQKGAVSLDLFELEHMAATEMSSYIQVKRIIDIVGALVLAPVALPVTLLGGLAVLVSSGWPIFFVQDRVGLGGEPFRMWKLRTMRPAAPGSEHRAAVPGDARVTPVGRLLRRTRIDELPQLWNVLKGDMSLIGPRPEAVPFHNAYTEVHPKFAYRCLVRPGISGWAQVNAPPSANSDEAAVKLQYDLYYVKRQSAALDLQIAIRTLWTVTRGAGVR